MENIQGSNVSINTSWPQAQSSINNAPSGYLWQKMDLQSKVYANPDLYQRNAIERAGAQFAPIVRQNNINPHSLSALQMQLPLPYQSGINPLALPYMFSSIPPQILAQQQEYERSLQDKVEPKHTDFRCHICGKLFVDVVDLQSHTLHAHFNNPEALQRPENSALNSRSVPAGFQQPLNLGYRNLMHGALNGTASLTNPQLLQNPSLAAMYAQHPYYAQIQGLMPYLQQSSANSPESFVRSNQLSLPQQNNLQESALNPAFRYDLNSYEKESVKRQLSGGVTIEGPSEHSVLPSHGDRFDRTTVHQRHLINAPQSLPDAGTSSGPAKSNKVNHKLIKDHIHNLILNNEKILTNPTLERVKPRRVFRRNSLDPASLPSHPNEPPPKIPLAERASFGIQRPHRNLEFPTPERPLKGLSPLSSAAISRSMWPQGLTQPNPTPISQKQVPSPGKLPDNKHLHPKHNYYADDRHKNTAVIGKDYYNTVQHKTKRAITPDIYCCQDCGVQFRNEETFQAHQQLYCRQNMSRVVKQPLEKRQSVIQHTDLLPTSAIETMVSNSITSHATLQASTHRDICRTRSADAAMFYNAPVTSRTSPSSPSLSPDAAAASGSANRSSIPTNKLPPKKKQLQLMRTSNLQNGPILHEKSDSCSSNSNISKTELISPTKPEVFSKAEDNCSSSNGYKSGDDSSSITPHSPQRPSSISPSSPKSPSNPTFGGLRRRANASPNNLENTVPRSNYKLLLHQLKLSNMQDIGYLSEAFYTSKNPNIKRSIASILWSDKESSVNTKTRRKSAGVALAPSNLPVTTDASLYRRKSHGVLPGELSRLPSYNLHGKDRSVSPPTLMKTDSNNSKTSIKEGKSDIQSDAVKTTNKEHLPLKRKKANAPFVVRQHIPQSLVASRNSPSPTTSDDEKKKLIENPTNVGNVLGVKRQGQSTDKITGEIKRPKLEKKDVQYRDNNHSKFQELSCPHMKAKVGFSSHVTYCSIMSPQPCCMVSSEDKISMYSQWATSDPILLPKDLTVTDILTKIRIQHPQSGFISYNSLFTTASEKADKCLKLVENKDYKKIQDNDNVKDAKTEKKTTTIAHKNINTNPMTEPWCYTSCHNKNNLLPLNKNLRKPLEIITKEQILPNRQKRKFIMPTVVIQPPSPEPNDASVDSPSIEMSDSDSDDTLLEASFKPIGKLSQIDTNTHIVRKTPSPVSQLLKEKLLGKLEEKSKQVKSNCSSSTDSESTSVNPVAKKRRRSKKERDAESPLSQRRKNGIVDSSKAVVQDPTLAVHPTGACSKGGKEPPCALCSMKAAPNTVDAKKSTSGEMSPNEDNQEEDSGGFTRPQSCSAPLTVTVPARNRDKSSKQNTSNQLALAKLDRARGKGSTQHWVSTSHFTTETSERVDGPNSKLLENAAENKPIEAKLKNIENVTLEFKNGLIMPPNQNPMSASKMFKTTDTIPTSEPSSQSSQLASVVSEVMRTAAMQSQQKKTINSHSQTIHPLSSSRPLIPGSYPQVKSVATTESSQIEKTDSSSQPLRRIGNMSRLSQKQLALSDRESQVFLSRANKQEDKITTVANNSDQAKISATNVPEDTTEKTEIDDETVKDDQVDCFEMEGEGTGPNPRQFKCVECKTAFRIAGHLAKHLKSKSHLLAMQKKTLNRLKQQQLNLSLTQLMASENGIVQNVASVSSTKNNVAETINGTDTLARAQVRAIFEKNDEYMEIVTQQTSTNVTMMSESFSDTEEQGERSGQGSSDPRPFKCIACKVAFRFQGHLDRHFRSNHHLLAVGHFDLEKNGSFASSSDRNEECGRASNAEFPNEYNASMSDDETGENFTEKPSAKEIEKCEKELADTDKKLQQLQALSESVDRNKHSLLNHNSTTEKLVFNAVSCSGVQMSTENDFSPNSDLAKTCNISNGSFENSNHFPECCDKNDGNNQHFSNSPLAEGQLSPVPIKLQQLSC